MIKLAIVDDNAVVRDNLKQIFNLFEEVTILWIAKDGEEAVWKVENDLEKPQVILMDIQMRVMNGIEATKRIKALNPAVKVVMLSVVQEKEDVQHAFRAGADGYLLKDEKPLKMLELVKNALENRYPLSPAIAQQTFQTFRKSIESKQSPVDYQLTKRETEVLEQLVLGKSYQEIANKLVISPLTVRSHMENLYHKLNVNKKAKAISIALKNNWF